MSPIYPELVGKVVLVTGGTSGIGFHTAGALARRGAVVYITGRDMGRGQEAEFRIRAAAGHEGVHFVRAEASTVGGNQRLAKRVIAETRRLNVLVNNVGGFYNERWETDDGYEATLATNFVGPFALTEGLLPALRESAPARIINVASAAHAMWKGDPFADVQSEESYLGFRAYARSKLLNILWTFALARRLEDSGVVANATNPGMAWTSGTKGISPRGMPPLQRLFWPVFRGVQRSRSAEKAANSPVFLASSSEAVDFTGAYFEGDVKPGRPSASALDVGDQERAWELAKSLSTGAPTRSACKQTSEQWKT